MNSIKEVIKASKSIHSFPNNQLTVMTPPLTQPHGQPPSQTFPHSSTAIDTQGMYIIHYYVYILFQSIHIRTYSSSLFVHHIRVDSELVILIFP